MLQNWLTCKQEISSMNQFYLFLICVISSYLLVGCGSNGTDLNCSSMEDLENVSGLQFYDAGGIKIGSYQLPNDCSISKPEISVYPNPAVDQITIYTSAEVVEEFWLVRANCPITCADHVPTIEEVRNTNVDVNELDLKEVIQFTTEAISANPDLFGVDVSTMAKGTYKAFLKLSNGEIIWQNILISESADIDAAIAFIEDNCR